MNRTIQQFSHGRTRTQRNTELRSTHVLPLSTNPNLHTRMTDKPEQAAPTSDQTEEQTAETLEYREISPDELQEILEQHRKWVETEGKEGKQADLNKANLQGAGLSWANLQQANLREAHLEQTILIGAHLEEADLTGAHLEQAELRGAHLEQAILNGAQLQKADLWFAQLQGGDIQGANLREVKNLTVAQIRSTTNYILAELSDQHLQELGLPPDHNKKL